MRKNSVAANALTEAEKGSAGFNAAAQDWLFTDEASGNVDRNCRG
jgi:hypothetical protein